MSPEKLLRGKTFLLACNYQLWLVLNFFHIFFSYFYGKFTVGVLVFFYLFAWLLSVHISVYL